MATNSKIEWTTHTFNPFRGCAKISEGCKFCYADTLSARNPASLGIWGPNGTRVLASESMWREPLKWNRDAEGQSERPRVFCASLADVFEDYSGDFPNLPDGTHGGLRCLVDATGARLCIRDGKIARQWPEEPGWRPYTMFDARVRLFELIEATPYLDWMLLTKRPENIAAMLPENWGDGYPNVWLGTSVENQEAADKRIPALLGIPARVRFLSCEPLLGPVDLHLLRTTPKRYPNGEMAFYYDRYDYRECDFCGGDGCCGCDQTGEQQIGIGIHLVIVGGESGPSARPMHPDWTRSLRDQCNAAGVAFHFKQHGEWIADNQRDFRLGAGDKSDWGLVSKTGELRLVMQGGKRLPNSDPTWRESETGIARVGKKAAGRLLDGRTWDELPEVAR